MELDIKGTVHIHFNEHKQLVHSETSCSGTQLDKMCYGMSTGAVRWLAHEMVEKNNIKDNAL